MPRFYRLCDIVLDRLTARVSWRFFTVIERFGAYTVLGLFFHLAYPRHLTFVCIMVFGSAVTLEVLQNLVPDRDPRTLDAIEKLLGGTAGIVLGLITETNRPRRD